jgi:hypothetical protein
VQTNAEFQSGTSDLQPDHVNCGDNKEIYDNSADTPTTVTVKVNQYCRNASGPKLEIIAPTQVKQPDDFPIGGGQKRVDVPAKSKLKLTCFGSDGKGCAVVVEKG